MQITTKIKLLPTEEQGKLLFDTMRLYNEVCNYISEYAFETKTKKQFDIHALVYEDARQRFGLTSQMVIRAIAKVAGQMKREFALHSFRDTGAIQYDSRVFRFKAADLVNLWTVGGRIDIKMIMTGYQKKTALESKKQANLVFVDNQFYLLVVIDSPDKDPIEPESIIGVDMGIVQIATLNDGTSHSGAGIERARMRFLSLRRRLQQRGTKSAKRRLKRLSKKEARFRADVNHQISKQIVSKAQGTNSLIAIEELKGIREKTTVRKSQRARHGGWSFFQLRSFIEYKAKMAGIPVLAVNPAYTSQQCPHCGNTTRANRTTQASFACECGYTNNADIVGAINIAHRAASICSEVNRPIVASAITRKGA